MISTRVKRWGISIWGSTALVLFLALLITNPVPGSLLAKSMVFVFLGELIGPPATFLIIYYFNDISLIIPNWWKWVNDKDQA